MNKKIVLSSYFSIAVSVLANETPNVIVIIADDLGYADVGFQDVVAAGVTTPNLNSLAQSGVIFRNAYASSPVCSSSRLGISTGRYPSRWGAYYYGQGGLPTTEHTIAEMMKEVGYRTMKVGKNHLNGGPKSDPMKHGFDHFLGFDGHSWDYNLLSQKDADAYERKKEGSIKMAKSVGIGPLTRDNGTKESFENTTTTEVFGQESISFINEKSSKPFYLQLEFNATHAPLYKAPDQMEKKYGIPHMGFDRDAAVWEYPYWDPIAQPSYKKWYNQVCHFGTPNPDPYGRKKYLAHLELMDQVIGNILADLKARGILENTLIFFTSDNGGSDQSYANNGPINAYKYCLMDGGVKVPMIMSWPKCFGRNKKVDATVTLLDLFATLSDIVKVEPKNPLDGKSLLPVIKGDADTVHTEPLFWDTGKENNWAVQQGDWKLVYRGQGKEYRSYVLDGNGLVTRLEKVMIADGMQLYNLAADAGETTNLNIQHPEKVASMEKLYLEWRATMSDIIPRNEAK